MDGVTRMRGAVLERALWVGDEAVVVRVAQPSPHRVVFGARSTDREAAAEGLRRMRRATGVDVDLRAFHDRYRDDPLIGASVRSRPHLRPNGRAEPFEALAWAVCEQLIEYARAVEIERRIIWRFGRSCTSWDGSGKLTAPPCATTIAGLAPAELEALDLAGGRSRALVRVGREVATGRVDLHVDDDHEQGWKRLRAISGIGSWTIAVLGLHGQARYDQLPDRRPCVREAGRRVAQTGAGPLCTRRRGRGT